MILNIKDSIMSGEVKMTVHQAQTIRLVGSTPNRRIALNVSLNPSFINLLVVVENQQQQNWQQSSQQHQNHNSMHSSKSHQSDHGRRHENG